MGSGTVRANMATGINQNIEILGRVFHIQTELCFGDDPKIRTTVYDGGRVVASREMPADPSHRTEGEILDQIRAQHGLIIDNLVTRSSTLAEQKRESAPAEIPRHAASRTARGRAARAGHPLPAGSDPSLRRSLRTRRLVGPFSQRFAGGGERIEGSDSELEAAGAAIYAVMGSPAFRGLRLDEQIHFFDLKERIDLWRVGGDPHPNADSLLDDVTSLAHHLAAINDRRELTHFDHRLLLWALGAIGSDGVTRDILGHLESLGGRDADLDRLLVEGASIDKDRLIEVLIGLLDRTLPGE